MKGHKSKETGSASLVGRHTEHAHQVKSCVEATVAGRYGHDQSGKVEQCI